MKLGIKAHWKDADIMAGMGTALMEIHLEPRDLIEHTESVVDTFSRLSKEHGMELVVHNQEYWFDGKEYRLVDLASPDELRRHKAIEFTRKALDLADRIGAMYLVLHPGGIFPHEVDNKKPLARLKDSLTEIEDKRILLENMPWFYIMRSGEIWHSNICIRPEDFYALSDLVGGCTLDICHAFLATKEGDNEDVAAMKDRLGDMIRHVHASDARPPHDEGQQIGDGLVDFNVLKGLKAGIIPEIIGGHKNSGEGFKIALERLRKLV
ncbi:MAG: sugar phosphate isomerase/epimerase [Thermoplasmata archaeon]|nr:MAG: sugar phosphate isomerase/epimerase [Thermoplasmata archaeon]